ncbi:MAG: TIGR01458 family HAD-type hydrolase [Rhizobiaceae bacterium]
MQNAGMISGVLLDLSGVLYTGDNPLPGALEAIARLREARLPMRFLTNTTSAPKRKILDKLQGMGFSCEEEELFTPATVAVNWLKLNRLSPHLLIHPDLHEDFSDLPETPDRAVIVGDAGDGFSYQEMNEAFRHLTAGAKFAALAKNRTFLNDDDVLSLDVGAFVAALEYGVQKEALLFGKPSPDFFNAAIASMGCKAEEAVMIGDDAEFDVSGALAAGIGAGLLVRTGKYVKGAEEEVDPRPTAVLADIKEAVGWILDQSPNVK